MELLREAIGSAVRLLTHGDPYTLEVLLLSLRVSLSATVCALVVGLPLGMAIAFGRFPGRRLLLALVNTGMGMPPVVVGLVVTILLWRSGPLGALGLLYTPTAMTLAQAVIALPLVVALSAAALGQVDEEFRLQLRGLGASRLRSLWEVAREARLPLLAAAMAGFGAAISEAGAALMVGGNLRGQTRVLTTAAVLETSKGNFDLALAFGVVLLGLTFVVSLALTLVQLHGRPTSR
jgi:tungstate transport system permease protein